MRHGDTMESTTHSGGCLCGSVRFTVAGPGSKMCYCHCRSCRLAAGAPFVAWATFGLDGFTVTSGELKHVASSPGVARGFCGACGTSITYRNDKSPAEIDLATATLDEPSPFPPACHIWVSHKLPWLKLGDGLPQYAEWRTNPAPNGGDGM